MRLFSRGSMTLPLVLLSMTHAAMAAEPAAVPSANRQLASFSLPKDLFGVASWYGRHHAGRPTASGEIHSPRLRTAAHRDLPFGTLVRVTNLRNGRSSVVKINDRGPFVAGRTIDLSERAARDLAMMKDGLAPVRLEVLPRE